MFGMGWGEIGLIVVVGIIVFGPERLPDIAKQAGGFVRTLRKMADQAKSDLKSELGDEFQDVKLRDLDPRVAIREAWNTPSTSTPHTESPIATPVNDSATFDPRRSAPHDTEAT
jgi:sec-independent protein translocase protein TatB